MRLSVLGVLAFYVAANAYVAARTSLFLHRNLPERAAKRLSFWTAGIYAIFACGMPIAHFLPEGALRKGILRVSYGFYGIFIYLFSAYVIVEIGALILRHIPRTKRIPHHRGNAKLLFGGVLWCGIILTCVLGILHSSDLTVRKYNIQVAKDGGNRDRLRVVLLADLHMGYSVGERRIENMVRLVNEQDADIILIAGDIFDNTVEGIDRPEAVKTSLSSLKSRLGVYACWGNHDVEERLFSGFSTKRIEQTARSGEMERFVSDCGITMLSDEVRLIDDSFYVIGRKDYENAGDGTKNRASLESLMNGLDERHMVISLEHEPRFLQENADAGVDVMLCGHTHDGQFFPLNIAIRSVWENPSGLLKKDDMYSIVTSGVGIYGPDMRVGTDADITVVEIELTGAEAEP